MEVTVVRLRRLGRKIPKEQLDSEPRVHGFMSLHYWILENGREPRRTMKELLVHSAPNAHCSALLCLVGADQTKLRGLDMVYTGTERIDGVEYPQAWWVRYDPCSPSNGVRSHDYASAGKRSS